MKKRLIRIGVLATVFVLALIGFSYYINRGSADMTADMTAPTLPTISFSAYGYKMNTIVGHTKDMDVSAIRDTVLPLDDEGKIVANIQNQDLKISKLAYTVLEMDGKTVLQKKKFIKVKDSIALSLKDIVKSGQEGIVKFQMELDKGSSVYYYAHVKNGKKLSFKECLKYIKTLHTNILKDEHTDDIKAVMEPNPKGDNTTLQRVTINSDLDHTTWGELKPKVVGSVNWNIAETKEAYTSVQLTYQVKCTDGQNEDVYNVREFFKVRCAEGEVYLLAYDRVTEEVFSASKSDISSKGVNLGVVSSEAQYKTNEKGTIVSFVQANELWSYNSSEVEFALVFSFADGAEDFRNCYDEHSIRILSMEENGSVTFAVYGYMNRGIHEGESGAAIYYFDLPKNVVEEKAFIPSNQSHVVIEKEQGKMAYYNEKEDVLFVLNNQKLVKVDLESKKQTTILDSLQEGNYVASEDGKMFAYQEKASKVIVLDFATESKQVIEAQKNEIVQPLGFVKGDFVYGVAKEEDIGKTSAGEEVLGMYKLEIRDATNKVVKTYESGEGYILRVEIKGDMITLSRATKQEGIYSLISEDHITNNEEETQKVYLKSYWTDKKETQYRLEFEEGIENGKIKVLKPKQILLERNSIIEFKQSESKAQYYVYGYGEMIGKFENSGEALKVAKDVTGVVISPEQRYVWEDGNKVSWYRNFEMSAFVVKAGENSLQASVRAVLAYEGKNIDVISEMSDKSLLQILDENCGGEAVGIQGCSVEDVRYLLDKGTPVIALTGTTEAIVFVGYDAKTITYINPNNGGIGNKSFATLDEMMSSSGNVFWGYMK